MSKSGGEGGRGQCACHAHISPYISIFCNNTKRIWHDGLPKMDLESGVGGVVRSQGIIMRSSQ